MTLRYLYVSKYKRHNRYNIYYNTCLIDMPCNKTMDKEPSCSSLLVYAGLCTLKYNLIT